MASTAAGLMKLVNIHAEVESHKAKIESLDEVLEGSWKEIAAIKDIVKVQEAQLDAACAKMDKLKSLRVRQVRGLLRFA